MKGYYLFEGTIKHMQRERQQIQILPSAQNTCCGRAQILFYKKSSYIQIVS
jgi:hypothetical protein